MILLPPKDENTGVEVRLLLAECRGPSSSGYKLDVAIKCMQLMDKVLWNRYSWDPLKDPRRLNFGVKNPQSLADVIKAPGQFAGFQNYPNYDVSIVNRIQAMLNIANAANDKRSTEFTAFIKRAINVAQDPSITDPSPGTLASWRTAGSGSPGSNFKLHTTILGNDFYYIP